MAAREILNRPIFEVTSLKKTLVQLYGVFAIGLVCGLFIGWLIWS